MKVVRNQIIIAVVEDGGDEGGEVPCVAESAGADGVENAAQVRVDGRGVGAAVVVRVPEVFDVFGEVAEEEDVGFADFAGYFNLCVGQC